VEAWLEAGGGFSTAVDLGALELLGARAAAERARLGPPVSANPARGVGWEDAVAYCARRRAILERVRRPVSTRDPERKTNWTRACAISLASVYMCEMTRWPNAVVVSLTRAPPGADRAVGCGGRGGRAAARGLVVEAGDGDIDRTDGCCPGHGH
jgi:hypothetical protein